MKPKRPVWALLLMVAVLVGGIVADWHASQPHQRFREPPPLALGNGPAPDAGHCSLAPK